MLLVAEAYGLWGLVILTWFSWRLPHSAAGHSRPPGARSTSTSAPTTSRRRSCAPRSRAAPRSRIRTRPTCSTTGAGPWVAALAARLGCRNTSRAPTTRTPKAGNINHALPITGGDLVFMLDADHVPLPGRARRARRLLRRRERRDRADAARVLQPRLDPALRGRPARAVGLLLGDLPGQGSSQRRLLVRLGARCCGARRSLEIGGVATETDRRGFPHDDQAAPRGLEVALPRRGPRCRGSLRTTSPAYLLQRDRWARGNLAVLHDARVAVARPRAEGRSSA